MVLFAAVRRILAVAWKMIPSVRAFIFGNSGSGKTTTAWNIYLSRFPRRLILDSTGEWTGRVDIEATTIEETVHAIRMLAPRKAWTVSYSMLDNRFPELVNWLVPVPFLDESPARIVGGMVLLMDEVDVLAPYGPPPPHMRDLYRRSRHCGLSVISCTQRPGAVSKEVPSQSNHRIAHFLDEPSDIAYAIDSMRWKGQPDLVAQWQGWTQRYPHGAAWRETQTGKLLWLKSTQ